MKSRSQIAIVAVISAITLVSTGSAMAMSETQVAQVKKAIKSAPVAELGATAAELVVHGAKADRADIGVTAVKAVAQKNRSAVAPVVSSISTIAPEIAPQVAAAAAQAVPEMAETIARVAALAAPDSASEISVSIAKVVPASAEKVSQVVAVASQQSKSVARTSSTRASAATAAKVFPPGSGGQVDQSNLPLNRRAYSGGVFGSNNPSDLSDYASPGSDPGRD